MRTLPKAILCDIDGTLAHGIMVTRKPYEWHKVGTDTLDEVIHNLLRQYAESKDIVKHKIILMSGRDSSCRQETVKWLVKHKVPYDDLLMRVTNDNRKDYIIKEELYDQYIRGKYDVQFVLDDRNQVVNMWRGLGLRVFQVAEGDF